MGNENDNKFTRVIKNFTSLQSKFIYSDQFLVGSCKWCLMAFSKGNKGTESLSLYLLAADCRVLPCEWRRHTKFSLTVVNQLSEKLSQVQERQVWFDQKRPGTGSSTMLPLTKLDDKGRGFLVNDEIKIVAEVEVLEVIGKLDVSEETDEEVNQPLKKIKLNDGGDVSSHLQMETSSVNESIDVNGFRVLPSQAETVRRIFERHPDTTLEIQTKNQDLRTSYINVLLSLTKMLFKSPEVASTDDLSDAEAALAYMKTVGFKLDWLEKKLDQVKEKKKKCDHVIEMEQQLHDLEQKCKNLKTHLDKEKAKILEEATTPDLYFSDVA